MKSLKLLVGVSAVLCALSLNQSAMAATATAKKAAPTKTAASTGRSESQGSGFQVPTVLQGLQLRPFLSYHFMSPTKLNNLLQLSAGNNTKMKIGGGIGFGVAADYPVLPSQLLLGLRLEHFSASSDEVSVDGTSARQQASLSGTPLMLTATYMVPVQKFTFGATAGAGLGLGYETTFEIQNSPNTATIPNGSVSYGATPFTGLVSAFAGYDFTDHIGLRGDVGYKFMKNSQMKAKENFGTVIKEGELLRDAQNNNIEVNAGGFVTSVSLVVTL